jgi:Rrf2 family protein
MLKLTRKADYGLIALKHLAVRARDAASGWGNSASAKEIADTYGVPLPLLSKILQKLARAGFLRSEHGTNGGYRLARDPRLITALEVIRAIDGPIILTACFTEHGGRECLHTERCIVREPLRKVHEGILRLLNDMTVADMSVDDLPADSEAQARVAARLYGLDGAAAPAASARKPA